MSILEDALKVTGQDRPKDYVHPRDDFGCTAAIWQAMIKVRYGAELPLTADFVGLMMAAMKISREAGRHKRDNLIDIAGYAECVDKTLGATPLSEISPGKVMWVSPGEPQSGIIR